MSMTSQPPVHHEMPKAQHRLEPGDRFPDFMLADQTGAMRGFNQRVHGLGTVMLLDADDAQLETLRSLEGAYQSAQLECLVINATAAGAAPWPVILADEAGRIRQSLREMSGQSVGPAARPLAFLLDRNQRILTLHDEGDLAHWALARWGQESPAPPAVQIDRAAPVLIVPNVLSPADCRALVQRFHDIGSEPGMVTSLIKGEQVRRVYETMKKRLDHRLSDPAVRKPLLGLIGRRLAPELIKAFHYRNFKFDRVLIACYDSDRGDYFKRHRDNQTPSTETRRFALTINLNSDEYDGGELIFPEYGDHRYKPPAGAAVLFSCTLLHEALPVTRGQRFALLSFLRDANDPVTET